MNMAKSNKFQNITELSFVFDPWSWFLVLLSVICYQLSVISYLLSVICYQLSPDSYRVV